jgi:hypothetical protein
MRTAPFALCLLVATAAHAQVTATVHFQTYPNTTLGSYYFVSYPHSTPIPDLANSSQVGLDKCDIGANGPDGTINADDLICWTWGDGDPARRVGGFQLTTWDSASCRPVSRTAFHRAGSLVFTGTPFAFDPTVGYRIDLAPGSGGVQQSFTKTFVDDCNTAFAPKTYHPATCASGMLGYLWIPYDYAFATAEGALCGDDTCSDATRCSDPTTCDTGLFPPNPRTTSPVTSVQLGVAHHDDTYAGTVTYARTVAFILGTRIVHTGVSYDIEPGASAMLLATAPTSDIVWDPARDTCY